MSSYLPFVALMAVPKARRRQLMPLALPAVAGMPAAQAGALAVVSADTVARREASVANAEAATAVRTANAKATAAVTAVLTTAVEHGAELTPDDLKHIPVAAQVVAAHPDILGLAGLEGATRADLRRAVAVIEAVLAQGDGGATTPKADGGASATTDGGTATKATTPSGTKA